MEAKIVVHGSVQNTVCKTASNVEYVARRGFLQSFMAGAFCIAAAPVYSGAAGYIKGSGNIRRLSMYSGHTGENLNAIYWIDGEYIRPVMDEINHFMRDWRDQKIIAMDYRNIDNLAATSVLLETSEPFLLLSGYRTKKTNDMLRRHSRNVARYSLHLKGQAADVKVKDRSSRQVATAAAYCASGGVGRYSGQGFVHIDCGDVRTWSI